MTTGNIDVVIVITCRNYEEYLTECLMSAHTQTKLCPVIVVHDDCGGTAPRGLSASRNTFLDLPISYKSDFVVFLDADDTIPPNYVQELFAVSRLDSVSVCGAQMFGDQSGSISTPVAVSKASLLVGNQVHASQLIPVQLLRTLGGYDATLSAWEDWELWVRAAAYGVEFIPTEATRLNYRRHAGSMNRVFHDTMGAMRSKLVEKYGACQPSLS